MFVGLVLSCQPFNGFMLTPAEALVVRQGAIDEEPLEEFGQVHDAHGEDRQNREQGREREGGRHGVRRFGSGGVNHKRGGGGGGRHRLLVFDCFFTGPKAQNCLPNKSDHGREMHDVVLMEDEINEDGYMCGEFEKVQESMQWMKKCLMQKMELVRSDD